MPVARAKPTFAKGTRFVTFLDTVPTLNKLLDQIRTQATKGEKTGVSEYSKSYAGARDVLAQVVNHLHARQVDLFANLGFSDPNDVAKKRNDMVNSVLSAWDAPAAKYAKSKAQDGDALRVALEARLREFDNVIANHGLFLPAPDK